MMTYFLISIITFFGLIFGIIITSIAKDELRQGKNYFIALQNVIISLSAGILAYFYKIDLYFVVILTLLVFFLLYLPKSIRKSYIFYPLLAIILYISSGVASFFIAESTLIFLYGFPTASLLVKKKKDILFFILNHISFLIIGNFIYLVF